MLRKWLAVALFGLSFQGLAQEAQEESVELTPAENSVVESIESEASSKNYIRDDLFVFINTGAGRNYRILGSINAGTPITILDRNDETEFSKITDDEGRTGWVETRFVTSSMSRAEQLPILTQRLADAEASLQGLDSENGRLKLQLNESRQEVRALTQENEKQAKEITRLTNELEKESNDEMIKWFTWGGIVAGAGVLLGVILTFLPKRRNRNSEWM